MKGLMSLVAVSAVAIGLATYGVATSVKAQNVVFPAGAAGIGQGVERGEHARERHPRIRLAIKDLRAAREELKEADHDFGGHRAMALRATDEAIIQLEAALNYDRK